MNTPWDDYLATIERPALQQEPEPKQKRRRGIAVPFLAAMLGAAVGASAVLVVADDDPAPSPSAVRVAAPLSGDGSSSGVAAVAEKVTPSVVRIDVTGSGGRFGRRASGTGSGVIYRPDGYIITNHHVVEGASGVEVTLSTGEQLPARVIGNASPSDDIAVVKVERTGLPSATLGSTADVQVGDLAVAIGSPFGLSGSVTAGVISALHRNIDFGDGDRFADAIQTDAPINPGNSGGALATANGTVIGINTAMIGGSSGNVGVGLAIPMDIARREADQIVATGRAARPFLGISGESVPDGGGALVQEVVTGGPAETAGLRAGDVIVAIEGTKVASMEALIATLARMDPDATVTVTYRRDGSDATARVTLTPRSS